METNQPTPPRSLKRTHSKIDAEAGQSNTTDQPLVASPDVEPSDVYVVHGHPTPQDEHIDKEPTEEEQLQAMKTAKLAALKAKNQRLQDEVKRMQEEVAEAKSKLKNPDAEATVKSHIKLLHEYNDIKDVGQFLIGKIADQRGVPVRDLYESGEFGVGLDD